MDRDSAAESQRQTQELKGGIQMLELHSWMLPCILLIFNFFSSFLLFLSFLFLEAGFHCVALAVLEPTM